MGRQSATDRSTCPGPHSCRTMAAAPGATVDLGVYDRFHVHAQMEHLQTKYHGTGHADMTKWEWATHIHRDTMASHVGHYTRLAYFALCENEPVARVRFNCLQAMIQPCGKPPKKTDGDMED